jgi:hypothetical protein
MAMKTMSRSEVESAIDGVIRAADKLAAAQIDAGACGTRRDWDKAHKAEATLSAVREEAVYLLAGLAPARSFPCPACETDGRVTPAEWRAGTSCSPCRAVAALAAARDDRMSGQE